MNRAFAVVEEFENCVAEFAGAKYAVATMTGTAALYLAMKYCRYAWHEKGRQTVEPMLIPAHTFISVPMAALQCGARIQLRDYKWKGAYALTPWPIVDGALRFKRGMYHGSLHCLSFHARKLLNIGEGGMILTNDRKAAAWLRAARYCGRRGPRYRIEDVTQFGIQAYMTPEKAARGLHLMEYIPDNLPDQTVKYPDLRKAPIFKRHRRVTIL